MPHAQLGYRGDVSAEAAWQTLAADAEATLIDVRTVAEWHYVGVPSLESIGKAPIFAEWQSFGGRPVPDFVPLLAAELEQRGISKDAPLIFICRSGARSRSAAIAMTAAGFTNCFNVGPGFEGPIDPQGHRNSLSGWRVSGLPWSQT
jgi:rhodanese-related sulfurtransferase